MNFNTPLAREIVQPQSRILYRVEEWDIFDGIVLPSIAIRDSMTYDDRQQGRVVFERMSARSLIANPPAESVFRLAAEPGDTIRDHRMHLRYTLGDDRLFIDDFEFRTKEPINGILDGDLAELIADDVEAAKAREAVEAAKKAEAKKRKDRSVRQAAIWGAGTFVGMITATVVIHRLGRRKP